MVKTRNTHFWKKMLGYNQIVGRNEMSAIKIARIDQLIIKAHLITSQPMCTHQDDVMGWYDRIIKNHVIINSRKYGIPENVCKLHSTTHEKVYYKTKNNSNISYTTATNHTPRSMGQCSSNGSSHWIFISIPMMEMIKN